MKKILFTLAICSGLAGFADAQETTNQAIERLCESVQQLAVTANQARKHGVTERQMLQKLDEITTGGPAFKRVATEEVRYVFRVKPTDDEARATARKNCYGSF